MSTIDRKWVLFALLQPLQWDCHTHNSDGRTAAPEKRQFRTQIGHNSGGPRGDAIVKVWGRRDDNSDTKTYA